MAAGALGAQEQLAESPVAPVPAQTDAGGGAPLHKPIFKRLFSPEAVGATVPGAVLQQLHNWPGEWGKQRSGFEKRIGSLYAQFAIGIAIEDTVKAIHYEDTRYRRAGEGNFFKRTAHVITGTVTAHDQAGGLTPAWSLPANSYGSWAIATLWSPREYRNARSIFEWGSAGLAAAPLTNFAKEFWPDLRGMFRKKKS